MTGIRKIGEHYTDGGLYQDDKGRYYCDCNQYALQEDNTIEVYILQPNNEPDGEPDHKVTAKLLNPPTEREQREKEFQLEYMMLSRLLNDARAFFGTGNEDEDKFDCRYHNTNNIWGETIESHIKGLREYWDKIPTDLKPEWCSEDEIKELERKIKN